MKPPSRRAVRRSRWLVWPLAASLALAVVGQASYSAFSAKVSNASNSLEDASRDGLQNSAVVLASRINIKVGERFDDLKLIAGELTAAERSPVDVAGVVEDAVAGVRAAHPDRPA